MPQIREGTYVVYPKTESEVIGTTVALGVASNDFKASRTACDKKPECIGLTYDTTDHWRGFKGGLWESSVGKVKVVGEMINTWVPDPIGNEEPEGWTN